MKDESDQDLLFGFAAWLTDRHAAEKLLTTHARWEYFMSKFDKNGTMGWTQFELLICENTRLYPQARRLFDLLDVTGAGVISTKAVIDVRRQHQKHGDQCQSGLEDLRRLLLVKFGNLTRAWRIIYDAGESGKCGKMLFTEASRTAGFKGDMKHTWYELTHGHPQSTAHLRGLDPEGDRLMWYYTKQLKERQGSIREGWFCVIKGMGSSNGRITLEEFTRNGQQMGFSAKDMKRLFGGLDKLDQKWVTFDEWKYMQLWDNRLKEETYDPGDTSPLLIGASVCSIRNAMKLTRESYNDRNAGSEVTDFTVVLTRAEYTEYIRRKKQMMNTPTEPKEPKFSLKDPPQEVVAADPGPKKGRQEVRTFNFNPSSPRPAATTTVAASISATTASLSGVLAQMAAAPRG